MRKTRGELLAADPASAARQYGIPPEWARFWIKEELNRGDGRK
jgi:hypothetical protein